MFVLKLKNAIALAIVILILAAGVGAWRYAAVAGQAEEKPVPTARDVHQGAVPKGEEPVRPKILPKDRRFQIDLRIEREKEGQRKLLASPTLTVSDLEQAASFGLPHKETATSPAGGANIGFFCMGPSVRVTVRAYFGDKVWLDMTVNQPTKGSFMQGDTTVEAKSIRAIRKIELGEPTTIKLKTGDKEPTVLQVTAAVRVIEKETNPNTKSAAEKGFQIAEFWRRTGRPDSARFCYEQIRRRYPNTIYDERAKERLAKLNEKP
jgi:hypothetical protein